MRATLPVEAKKRSSVIALRFLLLSSFRFAEQEASVLRRSHVARSACWPASTSRPLHQALNVHHHQGATEAAATIRLPRACKRWISFLAAHNDSNR